MTLSTGPSANVVPTGSCGSVAASEGGALMPSPMTVIQAIRELYGPAVHVLLVTLLPRF